MISRTSIWSVIWSVVTVFTKDLHLLVFAAAGADDVGPTKPDFWAIVALQESLLGAIDVLRAPAVARACFDDVFSSKHRAREDHVTTSSGGSADERATTADPPGSTDEPGSVDSRISSIQLLDQFRPQTGAVVDQTRLKAKTDVGETCYAAIWKGVGCSAPPPEYTSWHRGQSFDSLVGDALQWATLPDEDHKKVCHGWDAVLRDRNRKSLDDEMKSWNFRGVLYKKPDYTGETDCSRRFTARGCAEHLRARNFIPSYSSRITRRVLISTSPTRVHR